MCGSKQKVSPMAYQENIPAERVSQKIFGDCVFEKSWNVQRGFKIFCSRSVEKHSRCEPLAFENSNLILNSEKSHYSKGYHYFSHKNPLTVPENSGGKEPLAHPAKYGHSSNSVKSIQHFEKLINKTAGHHRHILRPPISLKIPLKRRKAVFF